MDVGDLIHNQVADKNGQLLPPGAMEGSYEIKDLDAKGAGYLYEGKTITDKTFGHATYGGWPTLSPGGACPERSRRGEGWESKTCPPLSQPTDIPMR